MLSHPIPKALVREYSFGSGSAAVPLFASDEIHVWRVDLSQGYPEVQALAGLLSADERERAARFRFDDNRKDYVVCRGALRALLGSYVNAAPSELRFGYSEFGRPSLLASSSAHTLEFNVSHSGGIALLAFAVARKIGIDVEKVRRDFSTAEIAERFFSMGERAALRELRESQRHQAFFRCWTRKEAFIKALGEGLSHPLHEFDVSLSPTEPPTLLATRPDAGEVRRWLMWDIQVPVDYAAALVAERHTTSS